MIHLDLRDQEYTGRGTAAYYYALNGNYWGVKLWCDLKAADYAFRHQSLAHRFGFGPAVGEKVDALCSDGAYYGYLTQRLNFFDSTKEEQDRMIQTFNRIGWILSDMKDIHCGRVYRNGPLMFCDFGEESIHFAWWDRLDCLEASSIKQMRKNWIKGEPTPYQLQKDWITALESRGF